jgi:hypothetical protein
MQTQEWHCSRCEGNFVEVIGQGIEAFLNGATASPPDEPSEVETRLPPLEPASPRIETNPALEVILSRILGLGGTGRQISAVAGQGVGLQLISTGGRPMGMFLRGSGLPGVSDSGGDLSGRALDDLLHHLMMTESSHRSYGASKAAIESLERIVVDDATNLAELGQCGISMDDFVVGETAIKLPCSHVYKETLITQWLGTHHTCPTCRYELPQSAS